MQAGAPGGALLKLGLQMELMAAVVARTRLNQQGQSPLLRSTNSVEGEAGRETRWWFLGGGVEYLKGVRTVDDLGYDQDNEYKTAKE